MDIFTKIKQNKIFSKAMSIVKIIIAVVAVILVMRAITKTAELKESVNKYGPFFEQKEDFDVLFVGTSHTINAVFPMKLWNDHGIVSYNLGGHGNVMATNYWVLKNALEYTTPKLVVIDCMNLEATEKTSGQFSYVHLSFDAFPNSITKFRAISDLLDDEEMQKKIDENETSDFGEKRTKIGLLWDYSVYHTRYKELTKDDFILDTTKEKGAESRVNVAIPLDFTRVSKDERWHQNISTEYLRKAIKECKDRGIDVLLTYLPFPANEVQQMAANNAIDIAEEMGVNYIDFLDLDLVDFDIDCYDENSHLNPSGARKVTKYLGNYIKENYNIPDRREDAKYISWNEDYLDYQFFMLEKVLKQESLSNYLMLLADDSYKVTVDIKDMEVATIHPFDKLLNNLKLEKIDNNIYSNKENADIAPPQYTDYSVRVTVYDTNSGGMIDDSYWNCNYDEENKQVESNRIENITTQAE